MDTYLNELGTVGHLACRANRADTIKWIDNNGREIEEGSDKYTVRFIFLLCSAINYQRQCFR